MKKAVLILLLALMMFNVSAYVFTRDYGVFSGTGFRISDLYLQYSSWFDFFIFLVIFLSLGKSVFGEHFKESKGIYIGIALILAFALLIYEEQSGFSLIGSLGNWGFLLIILFALVFVFIAITKSGNSALLAGGIILVLLFFFLTIGMNSLGLYDWLYYSNIFYYFGIHPNALPFIVLSIGIILIVLYFIFRNSGNRQGR